jgi:hypothetical protein
MSYTVQTVQGNLYPLFPKGEGSKRTIDMGKQWLQESIKSVKTRENIHKQLKSYIFL